MAQRTISTKIELSGEKEYRQAVTNINDSLGVLKSEMRKVSEQYKDNEGSVEALNAKNDVLERTLLTQKEKLEAIKAALQNSAEQYGEADKRTLKWQQSLNNCEADIAKTESAIKENNKALEESNDKTGSANQLFSGLADTLKSKLPPGAQKAADALGTAGGAAAVAIAGVTAAAAAAKKVYEELIDITKDAAGLADEINSESMITGLGSDTIQELKYAAELIDVSYETIAGSLTKLKKNMESAASGNADLRKTFEDLGVAVFDSDGNFRDALDVFYDAIDALSQIDNTVERDTTAMTLFGKSAESLNPLIIQGTDTLRALGKEAHDVGYVMDADMLEALNGVADAMERLEKQQDAIKNQIAAEFAPGMEQTYKLWADLTKQVGEELVNSGIIDSLGDILADIVAIAGPLANLLDLVLGPMATALDLISVPLGVIADTMQIIDSLLKRDWSKLGQALQWSNTIGGVKNLFGIGNNASGDANWRGGTTWVGENGPELLTLPSGSSIMSAQESRMATGGDTYNITISAADVQEFNDIVRIAQSKRLLNRMG